MKKRIYLNFLGLILLSALLLSAAGGLIFYQATKNHEIAAIKDRAALIAILLNRGIRDEYVDAAYYDQAEQSGNFPEGHEDNRDIARMTIIDAGGRVLLDSQSDAKALDNHGGRSEFIQALQTGEGEAIRFSETLGSITYYYALRLNDGNVLRISKTMSSIAAIFTAILPALVIVIAITLAIANVIARRLTGNIVRPLSKIDFEGENAPEYDELLPYVKKIERQKGEIAAQVEALKNRADTIEAITGNMREGLILIDQAGQVLAANKSALDIFPESGFHESSFQAGGEQQRNILEICRDMPFQQSVKACLAGENLELPYAREGKIHTIYLNPVYGEGEITGAVILFVDTTEKARAEQQRREFSANVSHELKTPLTTISALAEMIANGMARAGDIRDFAGKIKIQSQRLLNIIEAIIRLSEFDEKRVSDKESSAFDLYSLAESVIGVLQEPAREKGVSLSLSGQPLQLTANKRMIDGLLYNLIENGVKYNREGGRVDVTLSREGQYGKIVVADTGIGISEEQQNQVFQRFYRAEKSRSPKTGGAGLGLSIVKHIVEHHQGRIELTSQEGRGTRVTCYLPV